MTLITLTPRAEREQKTFRALLDAMARPGTPGRVVPHELGGRFAGAVAVLEALLDHEVTFAITGPAEVADILLRISGSRQAPLDQAGYVLCEAATLAATLEAVKDGTLEYPDAGAMVVCLVDAVDSGARHVLEGPGVNGRREVRLQGVSAAAVEAFSGRNGDLPLGIDLVLVTPEGRIVCLPRSTRVTREEA